MCVNEDAVSLIKNGVSILFVEEEAFIKKFLFFKMHQVFTKFINGIP